MNTILARLLGIGKGLWAFLAPILQSAASSTLTALLPVALDVVKSLATNGTTGTQKREAAVKQIQTIAIAEGIGAAESVVRLAVEMAVARMKAEQP